METLSQPGQSELFLVRVWAHADATGAVTWRGKAQHVVTGECHYFADWAALVDLLRGQLPAAPAGAPVAQECCPPAAPCWDTEF